MCGIFGTIGFDPGDRAIAAALDRLAHRGPDGQGLLRRPEVPLVFGHRRLSIIDLSEAGAQPMTNEDGSVLLTFNGEIYNHAELREELMRRGHRFKGRCDAEVIVHLYEEKGIELVDDLHGMFAFALWDGHRQRFFLVRDRLGIKPAYYHERDGVLAFASELKALRALPGLDRQPDPTAWFDFLTYGFVPAPKTIWRHAHKLPPAHVLEWHAGRSQVRRYWAPAFEPREELTPETALEELEELLATVVGEHLVSDVPVGVFLSAGVDSSLVTATSNRRAREPLRAFTISFPERENDEAVDAVEIARRLGSPIDVRRCSVEELLAAVPALPGIFDEPFGDHGALPMLGLCQAAASQLKVVLSGDGGDETHVGYGRYLKPQKRRALYALAELLPGFGALVDSTPLRRHPSLRAAAEGELGRACQLRGGMPARTKRAILELGPELADYDDYWLLREHDQPELSSLARQQALDLATYLPEAILTKVDRTAMHFGLEVRPPLLDHRMVEFAARLPDSLKVAAGVQKRLLRAALEAHLPRDLVYARKRAFAAPIKQFLREGLFRLEGDIDVFGAFRVRRDAVDRMLDPRRDDQRLWNLFVLELFLRHEQGLESAARSSTAVVATAIDSAS